MSRKQFDSRRKKKQGDPGSCLVIHLYYRFIAVLLIQNQDVFKDVSSQALLKSKLLKYLIIEWKVNTNIKKVNIILITIAQFKIRNLRFSKISFQFLKPFGSIVYVDCLIAYILKF